MNNLIIIGLGNYGSLYEKNRHNAGFIILDTLTTELSSKNYEKKFSSLYIDCKIGDKRIFFIKPQTYMNNSGISALQFKNFYKITENANILVIHDELDLSSMNCKIKNGGGDAGHNGLKSITQHIGADYWRLRVGIARPPAGHDISSFVLSNFDDQQIIDLKKIGKILAKNIKLIFEKDRHSLILNEINRPAS